LSNISRVGTSPHSDWLFPLDKIGRKISLAINSSCSNGLGPESSRKNSYLFAKMKKLKPIKIQENDEFMNKDVKYAK